LRRGLDAQLADRNTKGYDLLVGRAEDPVLRKVQVKSVRSQPWYVNKSAFDGELLNQVTIYVLLGKTDGKASVRYFIVRNRDAAPHFHRPPGWNNSGFIDLKNIVEHENRWDVLLQDGVVCGSGMAV
jgi:hypothetical protein